MTAPRVTNEQDISLPLAVWLLQDGYDYVDKPNYISATSLMKPLRQMVLPGRVPPEKRKLDVAEFIARSLGNSIHTAIEAAWTGGNHRPAMRSLGYTDDVIDRVLINPTEEELRSRNDVIPVYFEQRAFREIEIDGQTFTVGGKFDMVSDGIVNDFKSTSVWSWVKGTKDEDFALQGSLYRWLNPSKITDDFIRINFIFTDWSKMMMNTANYPQKRVEYKDIPLLSIAETEAWVRRKLSLYLKHRNSPESQLPECTDDELWRSAPQFKFYLDPTKATDPAARATKNFDDRAEANRHMAEKGKGIVIEKMGEPKACTYCQGFDACSQKDRLGLG